MFHIINSSSAKCTNITLVTIITQKKIKLNTALDQVYSDALALDLLTSPLQ
ncbi:MAG: Unknown protein [uncultured Aureispira sp.]|uniref:Uncharacterized protein n=1 Tax=uncultured Aureispira sp. TaxID=1331704 RepID=A0A6S6RXS3_9BACT|nr:MAG: Unknown protein [uncultured Aureispira sp.]